MGTTSVGGRPSLRYLGALRHARRREGRSPFLSQGRSHVSRFGGGATVERIPHGRGTSGAQQSTTSGWYSNCLNTRPLKHCVCAHVGPVPQWSGQNSTPLRDGVGRNSTPLPNGVGQLHSIAPRIEHSVFTNIPPLLNPLSTCSSLWGIEQALAACAGL